MCFFFFQAEDGIRDYKVTGVQTCALPISRRSCRCSATQSQSQVVSWLAASTAPARRDESPIKPPAPLMTSRQVLIAVDKEEEQERAPKRPFHLRDQFESA